METCAELPTDLADGCLARAVAKPRDGRIPAPNERDVDANRALQQEPYENLLPDSLEL
jgi:hypothetical protein